MSRGLLKVDPLSDSAEEKEFSLAYLRSPTNLAQVAELADAEDVKARLHAVVAGLIPTARPAAPADTA
jgi:hypothetical protein